MGSRSYRRGGRQRNKASAPRPGSRAGEPRDSTPPHFARGAEAGLLVARGGAAPAPLVSHLVQGVLQARSGAAELSQRMDPKIQRRRQNRELPRARAQLHIGPEQNPLTVIAACQRYRSGKPTPQYCGSIRLAPALQPRLGLDPSPSP